MKETTKIRCQWANTNPQLTNYHDRQWGVPVHNDRLLFEMLNLEGAQAGLSWLTVLKRQENYRQAFDNFNAKKIASYDDKKRAELLVNEGIIRNRLKINAVIENSRAFLAVQSEFGSFDNYIWNFTSNKRLIGNVNDRATLVSKAMSKDMQKRGFKFIGPTIAYAFMQSVGIVNDHAKDCFRFKEV